MLDGVRPSARAASGPVCDAGQPRLPRDGVTVARVPRWITHEIARMQLEVHEPGVIERCEISGVHEPRDLRPIRHDDQVVEGRQPGLEVRLDLFHEAGIAVDRMEVVDVDARSLREQVERLAAALREIDVEGPVRKVQPALLTLARPTMHPSRPGWARRRSRRGSRRLRGARPPSPSRRRDRHGRGTPCGSIATTLRRRSAALGWGGRRGQCPQPTYAAWPTQHKGTRAHGPGPARSTEERERC